jgi:hypothetical protein
MDKKLLSNIRNTMESKDANELINIWNGNDLKLYTSETLDIVNEILTERAIPIPPRRVDESNLNVAASKKCPFCAEEILSEAIKCKHCGSNIGNVSASEVKARKHPQYLAMSVLGFLLPFIGVILGMIYLAKDNKLDKKLGEHLIAWSILVMILFSAIWAWMVRRNAILS